MAVKRSRWVRLALAAVTLSLGACAVVQPKSIVTAPTTIRPEPALQSNYNQGSIFQTANSRQLFEERTAKRLGDVLTITIAENLSATNKVDTSTDRKGTLTLSGSGSLPGMPGYLREFMGATMNTSNENKFAGNGSTDNTNTFTGSLSATVIEVLPNGNLQIGGEKQIAINGHVNTLRLTGVINPTDIQAGNTIPSSKVADARIEQLGVGALADATTMGWLQRFFLSVMPY
ncbi:flagellar basal body L-ring protein FlgH [Silvimonas amylolytica]|uniref:Flagellar L-ring protein n=1 Tax=Silvimonas amylolytica TaxID=449663 RepID=A0ABQ2PHJ0_9NEIS|nr:flagellar basal body L-ring protein FlgH [Silvimonas amylolytica]GGP24781.1 flagellar L-ring protein [Silvimonas amylolytica]